MFRESGAGLIIRDWEKIASRVMSDFGLDYIKAPDDIRPSYESHPRDFGGWIEKNQLILSNDCLRGKIPHIGILARGYMRNALAKEGFEETVIDDFSYAFGALWLPNKYLSYWYKKWKEFCEFKGDETTGLYCPSDAFNLFQSFSGSDYFNKLLNEYILMKRNGLELEEEDYILHMLERQRRFSVQLTHTDFRLIRRLLESPETKRADLASETGKTVSWVSRRLVSLQEHGVLRRISEVFYPRLGLKQFVLLMNSSDESSILEYICDSPFLYSANRIVAGEHDLVAILLIPQNAKNFQSLNTYLKILADHDIKTELFDISAMHYNRCFDHYSTKRNTWEIPWELFGPHLRRIYDEALSSLLFPEMIGCTKADLKIQSLDFQIISEYQKGYSLRNLRAQVGIKYQRLVARLNRLKESGIIRERYDLQHCGLHESLLVHVPDSSHGTAVISWAQRLPNVRAFRGSKDDYLLFLQLPDGGLQGMALVLQALSPRLKPMLLDSQSLVGQWYLSPTSWKEELRTIWNHDKQSWNSSEDAVSRWLSELP